MPNYRVAPAGTFVRAPDGQEVFLYGGLPLPEYVVDPVLQSLIDNGDVIDDTSEPHPPTGGTGTSLPDQTGHDGEFLQTDGTDVSWAAGGTSVASIHVGFYGNSAGGNGGDSSLDLVDNRRVTVSSIPQTVAAGAGQGIFPYCNTGTLDLSDSPLGVSMEVGVSNADGTEKLIVASPGTFALPDILMTDWTVREQIGDDLAVSADGLSIDSTAGGQFLVTCFWHVGTIG